MIFDETGMNGIGDYTQFAEGNPGRRRFRRAVMEMKNAGETPALYCLIT
jgi:hypothetical protein